MTKQITPLPVDSTPDAFAASVLGMKLYPKQRDVLRALYEPGAVISFRSCNEGGKTKRVICAAILWHLMMFPKGHVISTSGCFRQIKDQLLPTLRGYQSTFPAWKFLRTPRIETPDAECFWEGFSTNEAGKFEGHHAGVGLDAPLLIIVDEAKTVKDDIFEAIERCKPTRLLIASSPGYAEGEFYRSHTTKAKFYQTFAQRAAECPHWTQAAMDRIRDKHGENHPLYRSMIMAEFMESVEDAVVDLKALEDLMANPPLARKGGPNNTKAFCDFAWGGDGDENVLALRDGNVVTIEETFHADNLHAICGRFIAAFNRLGLKGWQIDGDEGGGGKLICDQLQAMGWRINRVNNGAAPQYSEHYANLAAEMWFEGAKQIVRREIILPDDDELRAQLLDRKRVPNGRGKLAVESKTEMRKRGVCSPDRADAVFGAMTPVRRVQSFNIANINGERDRGPWDGNEGQWRVFGENDPPEYADWDPRRYFPS